MGGGVGVHMRNAKHEPSRGGGYSEIEFGSTF